MPDTMQQVHTKDFLYFDHLWSQIKRELIEAYGVPYYKNFFSKLDIESFSNDEVILSAPTNFIKDWINNNYQREFVYFWQKHDPALTHVSIITASYSENPEFHKIVTSDAKIEASRPMELAAPIKAQEIIEAPRQSYENTYSFEHKLDPRFTFDNFVVGPSNELAYAAAFAVAESDKAVSGTNPLFLYGGVGLGKTHLMHAIAHHITRNLPDRKVIYMSAEKFMYLFVQSLKKKEVMSFKQQFRTVDVLMIDDIQFISGKDNTQEEFFHTFNALIDSNRQVVISCDRSPSDLDNIEDRIRSRLGWGLVADVHSTTYELRIGILQSKVELMDVKVPQDVIEFLAAKITSNVRELEGALNKVIAHSTLVGRQITLDSTQDILRDLLRSNDKTVTVEEIQKKVAERYNMKLADMSSSRRSRSIARPRQIAMYLAKKMTTKSLADIGNKFGKKDHTTVMHAVKKVEELLTTDNEFQEEITLLERILQN